MKIGPLISLRRLWTGSIRRRLTLGLTSLVAVTMAAFTYQTVVRQQEFFDEYVQESAHTLAVMLAGASASWVMANDLVGLRELIESVQSYPDLRYAMVLTPDGRVLAHSDARQVGKYVTDEITMGLLRGPRTVQIITQTPSRFDLAAPVKAQNAVIGWARVGLARQRITDRAHIIVWNGIYYAIGSIAVGALLAASVARGLTRGLERLVTRTAAVASGVDVEPTGEIREDELGALNTAFDTMAATLKKTSQKLRENEHGLRRLMGALPTAVVVHGPDAAIRYCNDAAAEALAMPEGSAGAGWRLIAEDGSLLPPEDYPANRVIASAKPLQGCVLGVISEQGGDATKEAAPRWIFVNAFPDMDDDGGLRQVVVCFADITERKHAEELLHKRAEEFSALVENAPDPIARYDREGRRLYVNPAMSRLTGAPASSLLGNMPTDSRILNPAEAKKLLGWIRQVVETGQPVEGDLDVVELNGRVRHHHNRLAPERDRSGAVASVLCIGVDITDLIETGRRLRTLVENLPDMVARFDPRGRCLYVNPVVTKMFGAPAEAFINKAILEIGPAGSRELYQRLEDACQRAAREGAPTLIEVTWPLAEGLRDWEVRHVPEKDDSGTVVSILGVARDITDRKRAQEAVAKLNRELQLQLTALEQANKELETFSYSVSHDLKTPLRAIDGFIQILLDEYAGQLSGEAQRYLAVVRCNTARMAKLIDGLLDFIGLSRHPLRMEPVNIGALAQEVFDELRTVEPERNIRLALGETPSIFCDRALIRQALTNLIGNAIKFTSLQTEALIEIGCSVEGGVNVYYIKDNGAGFDMRFAGKLFGVFERLHRPEEFEGTGIGLAIVKRIIDRHGGRVWAESTIDQGATMYFSLPIRNEKH